MSVLVTCWLNWGICSKKTFSRLWESRKNLKMKKRLGDVLVSCGFIEERKLLETLSYQLGYPLIELDFVNLDKTLFATIPLDICREHLFVPVSREGSIIKVAFADPLDKRARLILQNYLGSSFSSAIASKDSVIQALSAIERSSTVTVNDENSIIGMINTLFEDAIEDCASDIHIEPMKDRLRVRFRRDGVMEHHKDYPKEIAPQLSTRIKVMAQSDITEKRRTPRWTDFVCQPSARNQSGYAGFVFHHHLW